MKLNKYYLCCIYLLLNTIMAASQAAGSYGQPAYKNKKLSPEARARDLLSSMNLDEKVMQTQCLWIQKSAILKIRMGISMKPKQLRF